MPHSTVGLKQDAERVPDQCRMQKAKSGDCRTRRLREQSHHPFRDHATATGMGKTSAREDPMSFCDHCEGQRFDRAQVLRALRATRKRLRKLGTVCSADQTLALAIEAV